MFTIHHQERVPKTVHRLLAMVEGRDGAEWAAEPADGDERTRRKRMEEGRAEVGCGMRDWLWAVDWRGLV